MAVRDGDHYVVDGVKLFVENFSVADTCRVLCRAPGEGFALLLVDPATPGVTHTLLPTLAGDKQSAVRFAGVRVSAANLVGDERQGWTLAECMLERATALTCALIVGATRKAVEMTVDYAKWRAAFGKPIGAFQVIQHHVRGKIRVTAGARSCIDQSRTGSDVIPEKENVLMGI